MEITIYSLQILQCVNNKTTVKSRLHFNNLLDATAAYFTNVRLTNEFFIILKRTESETRIIFG